MAYSTPDRWSHGDQPTDVKMQKYSDSLNAIHAITGDNEVYFAAAHLIPPEDENHFIRHIHRWLFYVGDGTLEDADAANETITLSDAYGDGTENRYDLGSVSWLAPGKLYYVSDCTWAVEDPDP